MMKKGIEIGSVVKFLIFLLIIGAIIFFIFSAVDSSKRDTKLIQANKQAETIYNNAEEWLSSTHEIVINAKVGSDQQLVFVSNEGNNRIADATYNGNIIASMYMDSYIDEFVDGNWIVVIDKKSLSVVYALWSEEKLTDKDAQPLTTLESQRQFYKDNKKIVGYASKN